MTTKDYAKRIGVKLGTVKRWVKEGLPVRRAGRRVIIDPEVADSWIAVHRSGTIAVGRTPVVYVARASTGLIKIGFSSNPGRRMRELSKLERCSVELVATFPGDAVLESLLHDRFSPYRAHGEWYEPRGDVEAFARALEAA